MKTLWDLVRSLVQIEAPMRVLAPPPTRRSPSKPPSNTSRRRRPAPGIPAPATKAPPDSIQIRYDAVVKGMLQKYGVRVRRWRTSMSGVAWEVVYRDGTRTKLIESPRPKGPMSAAVFLHEIGHHAIGLGAFRPRCLEEYHAWAFSLRSMGEHGLNVTDQVRYRMHASLYYAIAKARRRGLRDLPQELAPFTARPTRPRGPSARVR